jgi:ATP-dependent exoDNAse (exonuclease V) beta subunit (contains helicase and exonuclease domains)
MSAAPELDVFSCPLDGIRLVEASAGTGKTWNICGLYLRLLLERELPVESLLVVTFTKAATAELSGRIRERIVETLQILEGGTPGPDPFVRNCWRIWPPPATRRNSSPPACVWRCETFDEAAIFTIHGFCQRALADTPFAAGLPYELELVEDDSALRLEATQDFWRREVAGRRPAAGAGDASAAIRRQSGGVGRDPQAPHGAAVRAGAVGCGDRRARRRGCSSAGCAGRGGRGWRSGRDRCVRRRAARSRRRCPPARGRSAPAVGLGRSTRRRGYAH